MRGKMKRFVAQFTIGVFMLSAITVYAANENWKQQFEKVSDEYFDQVYFHYAPTNGTLVGYHQYDAQLEDYSRATIDKQAAELRAILVRLLSIDAVKLSQEKAGKPSFDGYIIFNVGVSVEGIPTVLGVITKSDGITDDLIEKG